MQGLCFIETELQEAPFSFLRNLFWKKSIDLNNDAGQLIFNHELVHIDQKHTYDKLFSQVVVCIFWMNPFYRIIEKELNLVHEFIADSKSIQSGDAIKFARMLLLSHDEGRYLDPAHSFFHSPIKRRLTMITNSKNITYSYLRKVIILPITLLILFIFSFTISKAQTEPKEQFDSSKIKKMQDERNAKPFDNYHPEDSTPNAAEVKEIIEGILKNPPTDRIYFVNGIKTSAEKIKKLKYSMILDAQLLPPEDGLKKYGVAGEKGVISFMLKNK